MAGYSGTPLLKKLGIKPGNRISVLGYSKPYEKLVGDLPPNARLQANSSEPMDVIHIFSKDRNELAKALPGLLRRIKQDGMIWVSWPKKASGVPTTITEDVVREIALPLGLVDVKVCAVDEVWSGLKLVIRRENRK
jgi:hypothetical protein